MKIVLFLCCVLMLFHTHVFYDSDILCNEQEKRIVSGFNHMDSKKVLESFYVYYIACSFLNSTSMREITFFPESEFYDRTPHHFHLNEDARAWFKISVNSYCHYDFSYNIPAPCDMPFSIHTVGSIRVEFLNTTTYNPYRLFELLKESTSKRREHARREWVEFDKRREDERIHHSVFQRIKSTQCDHSHTVVVVLLSTSQFLQLVVRHVAFYILGLFFIGWLICLAYCFRRDACVICLERIGFSSCKVTHCNHLYHTVCLNLWLKQQSTCPLCRRKV